MTVYEAQTDCNKVIYLRQKKHKKNVTKNQNDHTITLKYMKRTSNVQQEQYESDSEMQY